MAKSFWFIGSDCYAADVDVYDVDDIITALKADGADRIHVVYLEE